jgi:uncharacterized protein with PQ loop repeat
MNFFDIGAWFFLGIQGIGLFLYAMNIIKAKNSKNINWQSCLLFAISQLYTTFYCYITNVPVMLIIYNVYATVLELLVLIKVIKNKFSSV